MSVSPIPDGYTTITPFLVVDDGAAAIDFYTLVFGARLIDRMDGPDGTVAHAELDFGNGRLQLSDPNAKFGLAPPARADSVDHAYVIYVPDVDNVVRRAVDAGATAREEVSTFVTGDRFGSIIDPFGHRWAVMTRVEDVSPEEQERRLAEWGAQNL